MGWWNAAANGESLQREPTGLVWGDGPADAMDDALARIQREFAEEWGRLPTKIELRAGLEFSLRGTHVPEFAGEEVIESNHSRF